MWKYKKRNNRRYIERHTGTGNQKRFPVFCVILPLVGIHFMWPLYNKMRKRGVCNMDQKKIGCFIAARRKDNGLTQSQLAEKLGITDKAVSK